MQKVFFPQKSEVVKLYLDPVEGHEQAGWRPVLVLSPGEYNRKTGLALICPITSTVRGNPFEVAIPAGLPVTGVILSDQVRCIDWKKRKAQTVCAIPPEVAREVTTRIKLLIE